MASIKIPIKLNVSEEELTRAIENAIKSNPEYMRVVRCRDCVRCEKDIMTGMYICTVLECPQYVRDDHFCSLGERNEHEGQ